MAKVVIIGAGLTGLSVAYHLEQQGFFDYTLLEKESIPGGLCRSLTQDGFTFDYTGHLLHINDPYFELFIKELVSLEHFNHISRRSFIYSQERYTRYPYQSNLYGLPIKTIAECIEGFIKRPHTIARPRSFYKWVQCSFGQGFGTHFFFPYQRKIFDYDVKKLSSSWTSRFVPKTSLEHIIQGSLQDQEEQAIGYNAHFLYPKQGGIYSWVNRIAQKLVQPIEYNKTVKKIDVKQKHVLFNDGSQESFTHLVTTMPLDTFLNILVDKSSSSLKTAARSLRCTTVLNFNLGVKREKLENKHWIYYPESLYPFYRIGFTSNFSDTMAPKGCSSLYGEVSFLKKPQWYQMERLKESLAIAKKLFKIDESEIATERIIPIHHAYVIYNHWRDKYLPILLRRLENEQIHSIGRYGAWKYSSMQDAVLDGKSCALKLLAQQT